MSQIHNHIQIRLQKIRIKLFGSITGYIFIIWFILFSKPVYPLDKKQNHSISLKSQICFSVGHSQSSNPKSQNHQTLNPKSRNPNLKSYSLDTIWQSITICDSRFAIHGLRFHLAFENHDSRFSSRFRFRFCSRFRISNLSKFASEPSRSMFVVVTSRYLSKLASEEVKMSDHDFVLESETAENLVASPPPVVSNTVTGLPPRRKNKSNVWDYFTLEPGLEKKARCNSTYDMLNAALKLQAAFLELEVQDTKYRDELNKGKGVPTTLDWQNARGISKFLEIFKNATVRISGSSYVTSNRYMVEVFSIGGSVPLVMVLSWNLIVLGPVGANKGANFSDPISLLLSVNPSALFAVQGFAFSAMATSLIGYAVSLPKQILDTFELVFGKNSACNEHGNETGFDQMY